MSKIALVALENTFFAIDTDFSYVIPNELQNDIEIGALVKVPFGRGNTKRKGIVVKIEQAKDTSKLKSIISFEEKVLSKDLVDLAIYLKSHLFCSTYDCLKLMLPKGFREN